MKTWVIVIIMFFSFLFFSRKIMRFLDKILFYFSFLFEKNGGQMDCRVISFTKKHRPSFWAGQMDYHLEEYYVRVIDSRGRSHDLSIVYKEDYEDLAKICREHNNQRVVLIVDKKVFRGMYEVTHQHLIPRAV